MLLPNTEKLKKEYDRYIAINPEIPREQVVKKIIDKRAFRCGIIGAVTSFGGFVTILITLPIDIYLSTKIETEMIYLLGYAYGYGPDDSSLEPLAYYISSGTAPKAVVKLVTAAAREAILKTKVADAAMTVGKETIKETGTQVFRKVMKQSGGKTIRKNARKMFIKTITRGISKTVAKIFPIIGAIIGYYLNLQSAQRTGKFALHWFNTLDEIEVNIEEPT